MVSRGVLFESGLTMTTGARPSAKYWNIIATEEAIPDSMMRMVLLLF